MTIFSAMLPIIGNDLRISRRQLAPSAWLVRICAAAIITVAGIFVLFRYRLESIEEIQMVLWICLLGVIAADFLSNLDKISDPTNLQLLCASPVPYGVILGARAFKLSVVVISKSAILVVPGVVSASIQVSASYIFNLLLWPFIGLFACALALGVYYGVSAVLAPRKLLLIANVLAMMIVLAVLYAFANRDEVGVILMRSAEGNSLASWIFKLIFSAGEGDAMSLIICGTGGVGSFLAVIVLGQKAHAPQLAFHTASYDEDRLTDAPRIIYGSLFWTGVIKDLKILARGGVLWKCALTSFWIVAPFVVSVSKRNPDMIPLGLAVLSLSVAAALSGRLSYLLERGDECWIVVRQSPASGSTMRHARMFAAALWPLVICVVLSFTIGIRYDFWLLAFISVIASTASAYVCGLAATVGVGNISQTAVFGSPGPVNSREFIHRLLGIVLTVCFGLIAIVLAQQRLFSLVSVLLVLQNGVATEYGLSVRRNAKLSLRS